MCALTSVGLIKVGRRPHTCGGTSGTRRGAGDGRVLGQVAARGEAWLESVAMLGFAEGESAGVGRVAWFGPQEHCVETHPCCRIATLPSQGKALNFVGGP